jgi:hypothetical protein
VRPKALSVIGELKLIKHIVTTATIAGLACSAAVAQAPRDYI